MTRSCLNCRVVGKRIHSYFTISQRILRLASNALKSDPRTSDCTEDIALVGEHDFDALSEVQWISSDDKM